MSKFKSFNQHIHAVDDDGNPLRKNGDYVVRDDWADRAVDRQSRPFDAAIHESNNGKPVLLSDGYIKMRPPRAEKPIGSTPRLAIPPGLPTGYQYRWVNVDSRGRPEILEREFDWSPVMRDGETIRKSVGIAAEGLTGAILMRKPKEWYDADQRKKDERNARLEKSKAAINPDTEYAPGGRQSALTDERIV